MMIDAENTLNEKIRVSINSECAYKLRDHIHKISISYGSDTTLANLFIIIDQSKQKVKFSFFENESEMEIAISTIETWSDDEEIKTFPSIYRFCTNLKSFDIFLQLRNKFEDKAISFSISNNKFIMKIYVEEYSIYCKLRDFEIPREILERTHSQKLLWRFFIKDQICEGFKNVLVNLFNKKHEKNIILEKIPFNMLGIRDMNQGHSKLHIATEDAVIEDYTLMSYDLKSIVSFVELLDKAQKLNFYLNENGTMTIIRKEGGFSYIGRFYMIVERDEESN
jgi:hypothetical protein